NRPAGGASRAGVARGGDGLQERTRAQAELSGSGNEPFPFGSVADENGERSLSVQKRESLENLIESLGHTMEAGVDRHKSFLLSIADQAAPSFRSASLRAERRRVHTVGEVVDRHGGDPAPHVRQNPPALPGHEPGSPIAEGLEALRQSESDSLLHDAQTHRAVGPQVGNVEHPARFLRAAQEEARDSEKQRGALGEQVVGSSQMDQPEEQRRENE